MTPARIVPSLGVPAHIVQEGTHGSLIQVDGPYRRLCEEQFGYIRLDGLAQNSPPPALPATKG